MIVYRLARKDRTGLDGKGAALYPGRWNEENIPCLYTSESPSLAQLEVMVNVDDWKIFVAIRYCVMHMEVPDQEMRIVTSGQLPVGWDRSVHSAKTKKFGGTLLNDPTMLAFAVPSAISKLEKNVIINPRARKFHLVRLVNVTPFEFDERLIR
jgi:RES domain-containing protein